MDLNSTKCNNISAKAKGYLFSVSQIYSELYLPKTTWRQFSINPSLDNRKSLLISNMVLSSAYNRTILEVTYNISIIDTKNTNGPKTEPCGIAMLHAEGHGVTSFPTECLLPAI